ncbi:MAG: hypothetical protein NVS4B3_01810 [Gemmatimonadaceae bacterium]
MAIMTDNRDAPLRTATPESDPFVLLAAVSRTLASSLDYETTLASVARLALPHLGSWSIVDVCETDGTMRRLTITHPEREKQALARALEQGWPPERDDPIGVPVVMRTRRSVVLSGVTDALLRQIARTPENLQRLRALGIGSLITVPMVARDAVLGAITFVSAEADRPYDGTDLALAEDLVSRAAVAVDNARLYRHALGRMEAEAARTAAEGARSAAEAANEAKTQFLTTMSHELRTPLNAIAGYAELLEMGVKGPITDAQRDLIRRIQRSQQRLLALINDVLNFARIESGRLEYHVAAVPVGELLEGIEEMVAPVLEAKHIGFTNRGCEATLAAQTDCEKAKQVVLNLVSNAAKFTPTGGAIAVECEPGEHEVVIHVRDTGPGIPADKLTVIFEPFVQVDQSLTRPSEGVGLGLAISRDLARGLGGDITVDSTPGAGSVFSFRLPRALPPAVAPPG